MSKHQVAKFFDAYAVEFDALYGGRHRFPSNLINKYLRKSMRLRFEKTIAGCLPVQGARVLDIGCGPGHYSIALAKRGAGLVCGIDFAPQMIELAKAQAAKEGVAEACDFKCVGFEDFADDVAFDYSIAMGFMDYVAEPRAVIEKVLSLTTRRAFFSFPINTGFLAWQRRVRYRSKCPLYMYGKQDIERLFEGLTVAELRIEQISRDYFVTAVLA